MALNDKDIWINRAALYAAIHHSGQKRKYTGEDYIVHCASVALVVSQVCPDVRVICAAWLHDTVEDTEATFESLEKRFGPQVTQLVREVTEVSIPGTANRAARKQADREHYAKASYEGKIIKLADLIDNTRYIVIHDPDFSEVYMKEKRDILEDFSKTMSGHPLYKSAKGQLDEYFSR